MIKYLVALPDWEILWQPEIMPAASNFFKCIYKSGLLILTILANSLTYCLSSANIPIILIRIGWESASNNFT